MNRLLLFILILGIASPALAANGWFKSPTCTGASATSLSPSGSAYFCIDADSVIGEFSTVLPTANRTVEISRMGDTNQLGPGSCDVKVHESFATGLSAVTTSVGLREISGDTNGDGIQNDRSLNGAVNRRSLPPFIAVGVTIEIIRGAQPGEQCVIAVHGS